MTHKVVIKTNLHSKNLLRPDFHKGLNATRKSLVFSLILEPSDTESETEDANIGELEVIFSNDVNHSEFQ